MYVPSRAFLSSRVAPLQASLRRTYNFRQPARPWAGARLVNTTKKQRLA